MYKKILLPTDGSECANRAAKHAITLACPSGAEIIALNVTETTSFMEIHQKDLIMQASKILEEEGRKTIAKISKFIEDECPKGIKLTTVIEKGHAADIIVKKIEEENIDIVVMGTAGKHRLHRFLLGSVTEKVIRSAICPVLVVP